jgi:hypothetical protein
MLRQIHWTVGDPLDGIWIDGKQEAADRSYYMPFPMLLLL